MHSVAARILGIVVLLVVIAAPIAGTDLFSSAPPGVVLAEEGSPAAGATELPADPALLPGGDTDGGTNGDTGDEATLSPTSPPTATVTDIPVVPAESSADPTLHTISATIDDPTTCVAGRSWWFSISNEISQEKNPAEIVVTFVGGASVAVPLDSPGSGAGFEAIYIFSGNLEATLQSATAQVDSGVGYTFLLVKGPHCPGIPDEVASFTPTNTPSNTATNTATPTATPTVTQTPRPTKEITAQLDDPVECGDHVFNWRFSISNPVSFDLNPDVMYASFPGAANIVGYADEHNQETADGFTTSYFVITHWDDELLSAMAIVDAAVDHTFKLVKGPHCAVRTPTPSNTPTITPTATPTSTQTLTPTVPAGSQYVLATLNSANSCQISTTRWRFEIANRSDERANPVSIVVTFRDGTQVTVPRSETVRDQDRALISHYDWDQNLNGTVASAKAVLFTDGTYQFVLLEGPNCFGSPTPTVTSTPDQTCKSQNGQYTRICAVIDLKSCKQYQIWVFTIAPQFFEPQFPDSIVVNFSDGSSTSLSGDGTYRDGDRIWRDYMDYTRNAAQPGAAWANVPTSLNDSFGYVFKLKSGPGCHGLGEGEPATLTPTPTDTVTATLSPSAPSATPPLTRTPYPTDPARTPTPPIGVLPATGAGDSETSAGMMTLLGFAAVVVLALAIRRRNIPG